MANNNEQNNPCNWDTSLKATNVNLMASLEEQPGDYQSRRDSSSQNHRWLCKLFCQSINSCDISVWTTTAIDLQHVHLLLAILLDLLSPACWASSAATAAFCPIFICLWLFFGCEAVVCAVAATFLLPLTACSDSCGSDFFSSTLFFDPLAALAGFVGFSAAAPDFCFAFNVSPFSLVWLCVLLSVSLLLVDLLLFVAVSSKFTVDLTALFLCFPWRGLLVACSSSEESTFSASIGALICIWRSWRASCETILISEYRKSFFALSAKCEDQKWNGIT